MFIFMAYLLHTRLYVKGVLTPSRPQEGQHQLWVYLVLTLLKCNYTFFFVVPPFPSFSVLLSFIHLAHWTLYTIYNVCVCVCEEGLDTWHIT